MKMYEADIVRSFTYSKRHDHKFRAGKVIDNLTEDEVKYLKDNAVIDNVREMGAVPEKAEVIVETAEIKPKAEKAVKKVTKKKCDK